MTIIINNKLPKNPMLDLSLSIVLMVLNNCMLF